MLPPRGPSGRTLGLVVVWLVSAVYLSLFFDRGWVPGDEGLLGQTAERVLAGELPHRDFDDTYTGGLAFLHAFAFLCFGTKSLSIRWLLLIAALIYTPLYYRLALRFAPPWLAAAATLLALTWSLPNYFAGLPSWYNLFLAVGSILALFALDDTGRSRWAFVAGLCGGVSLAIKSAGLLHLAAMALFLVFREKQHDEAILATDPERRGGRGYSLFVSAGIVAFVAAVARFFSQGDGAMAILLFVAPTSALGALILLREWRTPGGPFGVRFRRLLEPAVPMLAGFALPMLGLLLLYWRRGALSAWMRADFLFPRSRLDFASWPLPPLVTVVCALPFLALFLLPFLRLDGERLDRRLLPALAGLLAVVLVASRHPLVYQTVWYGARPLVPLLVVVGVVLFLRSAPSERSGEPRLFLLLAMTSLFSCIQFTYSLGIYFCYGAPLVILSYLALARRQPRAPLRLHAAAGAFFALFAAIWMNPGIMQGLGIRYIAADRSTPLDLPRSGLRVSAAEADVYRALVAEVERRSPADGFVVCLPDCPEVAFLAARRSAVRSFADFLEADYGSPQRILRILRALEEHDVAVVVLNSRPAFSPLPAELATALAARYLEHREIGPFSVRWRPAHGPGGAAPPS